MINKQSRLVYLFWFLIAIALGLVVRQFPPILYKAVESRILGRILIADPMWGAQAQAIVFTDNGKLPADRLAKQLAQAAISVIVVDVDEFFKDFGLESAKCLDSQIVSTAIHSLIKELPANSINAITVAGIGEGALIPLLNAVAEPGSNIENLSIGFSVDLPKQLRLCPAVSLQIDLKNRKLVAVPTTVAENWRVVWVDQPADDTGIFIKSLGHIRSKIAEYDTPAIELLRNELNINRRINSIVFTRMPVVETASLTQGKTLTLFYSGDGGWRDLDRSVAEEMVKADYPVVGIDVLRYFWASKTPEQAAADLAQAMAFYRETRETKAFVLAGYSFGADILPAIYNRLPEADKNTVKLLVLLALARQADFEIHVSGWIGQSLGERALAPELAQIPPEKILCIYGQEEKAETACTTLHQPEASLLELPGGHHFDQDYPKLARQILTIYREHGIE